MVQTIFNLITARQTSILSGAAILMATLIISKMLGLLRYRLLASIFPPETVAIYIAAQSIPELIFTIFIFGTLAVAFIPVFTEHYEREGKENAFKLSQAILNICLITLIVLSVVVYIFIDPLTFLVAPGFNESDRFEIASLTKLILLGQIILTVGSLFVGILQSFRRFIIPALAGIFYNVGSIFGIMVFSGTMGISGAAIGVIIGAVLHVLVQVPLVFALGFRWGNPFILFHPGIKDITRMMSIRSIGLAAEQINEVIIRSLASLVSPASVTYIGYAQQLQLVPVALFGSTIAQAALPILSLERARGRMEEFKAILLTTMHQILFLSLPAAAILVVLRIPVVRLVFGASQFNWPATVLTGQTVAYLAVGLGAQSISLLFIRAFYAMKDTRTPVFVSVFSVTINIILSVLFVSFLQLDVWSLGLGFAITSILSATLLFTMLHQKVGKFDLHAAVVPFLKMLTASVIMGIALYVPIKLLDEVIFDTTRVINLLFLTGLASLFGLFVYGLLVWFLKVRELQTYVDLLRKVGRVQTLVKSEEIIHETDTA